jgi:uncharacterized protein YjiS (DUF1127 family)
MKEIIMTMFTTIRTALTKRAAYIRTRNEIRAMPQDVALDLGIFRGDADAIAYQAIYG